MASLVSCHGEKYLCTANLFKHVQHASAQMATQLIYNTSLVSCDATQAILHSLLEHCWYCNIGLSGIVNTLSVCTCST